MKWSSFLLLSSLTLCLAGSHPAWKTNTEYVYRIKGRTLTSLHELSDQYSGIVLKAKLHVTVRQDDKLQAWISDAQYAQIHTELPNGWDSELPDAQLHYKELALSPRPFQIVTKNGCIKSLIVEQDTPNWEANVIKSVVNQLQIDLNGENVIESPINDLPTNDRFEGVYKTLEMSLGGECETMYEIHRYPEYLIQSQPWLVPRYNSKDRGQVYEVIKNRNYTNNRELPLFHYGFRELENEELGGNRAGQFLTRQANSRIFLTGKLNKYMIQSSVTVNKVIINPTFNAKQRGMVVSAVNLTLTEVKSLIKPHEAIAVPMEIGNLVYTYDRPFAPSNEVHQKTLEEAADSSSEENLWTGKSGRIAHQYQERPPMSQPPHVPLLPYYTGYDGKTVKSSPSFDVLERVKDLVNEISEGLSQPEKILKQSTLSKYSMLCSLIRVMNKHEIRTVTESLYNTTKPFNWIIFRDAVAEAGTGPAYLNIEEWISTNKIEKKEAADVVATMANSVRTPTEEYMTKFFDLVQKQEISSQEVLNETALLSFTQLVHKASVQQRNSHNQYPVHSFRLLNNKQRKGFVNESVIPYLAERLRCTVNEGDCRKMNIYIRALGNVGHTKILEIFEPYLEGSVKVHQFQRLLMVLSLDKLVVEYPEETRNVLYKIYQNVGEVPEVRVAAVWQLMRCQPSAELLHQMSVRTNTDAQEEVNAAVKSAIETASQLTTPESDTLRKAAESAKVLLTKKRYGYHQSSNFLKTFVVNHLDLKQNLGVLGSSDSFIPKGLRYTLRGNYNGMTHYFFNVQAMVSSVQELTRTLESQLHQSHQWRQETEWSSPNVAKKLNLSERERQSLEGFIDAEMYPLSGVWSFNNETINKLPQVIREAEELLKEGKQIQYAKLRQLNQLILSIPTETGFPFMYTFDVPTFTQIEGQINGTATPAISRNGKLHMPAQIEGEFRGFVTVSVKVESRLTIITPFDHQLYMAGADRNMQIHLPLKVKVDLDLKRQEANIEYQLRERHPDARLFHSSCWPYTSTSDIMDKAPVASRPNTYHIYSNPQQRSSFDMHLGKRETGLTFAVWGDYPRQSFIDLWKMLPLVKTQGLNAIWEYPSSENTLEHSEINVRFLPQQSTTDKVVFNLGYKQQYSAEPAEESSQDFLSMERVTSQLQKTTEERQQEMLRHVCSGIQNCRSHSLDVSCKFEGQEQKQFNWAVAFSRSNTDPKSRFVVLNKCKRQTLIELKGVTSNRNELDWTYSLDSEPEANYEAQLQSDDVKIKATITLNRSQARKKYLEESGLKHACAREMKQGNQHLGACQNMAIAADYLNKMTIEVQPSNMPNSWSQCLQQWWNAIYPMTEVRESSQENRKGHTLVLEYEPEEMEWANFTVRSGNAEATLHAISAKKLLVPHATFNHASRFHGYLTGQDNIRHSCVVDQSAAQTFSNRTYPLTLTEGWTVAMHYAPQSVAESQDQKDNFSVLIRELSDNSREAKVLLTSPKEEDQGKTIEIYIKPHGILVNGQDVQLSEEKAAELFDGYVEMYQLPNQETKLEIRSWFSLVMDKKRVKLTALTGKLRDSIVGLCGRFNGDLNEDFWVPEDCFVKSPRDFVESFRLENKQRRKGDCVRKELPIYTKVVNSNENSRQSGDSSSKVTELKNKYVTDKGQICFTLMPVPQCKNGARKTVLKQVPVHCVSAKAAFYFKNQIDRGGNPDFSHKPETRKIDLEVAVECA